VFGIGSDDKKIHRRSVENQQFRKRNSGCGRKPVSKIAEPCCFGTISWPSSELLNNRIVDSGGKGTHPNNDGYCSDDKTDDEADDTRNYCENCREDQAS
jgi:hypothetical protein